MFNLLEVLKIYLCVGVANVNDINFFAANNRRKF